MPKEEQVAELQWTRDVELSRQLRPDKLNDFVGQDDARQMLRIMTKRGSLSDTVMFVGSPGLGKTTLAQIAAGNQELKLALGGKYTKPEVMERELRWIDAGDILFIDEIHAAKPKALEMLYSAVEDNIVPGLRYQFDLPPWKLLAATTDYGKVPQPLRDRMGQVIYLDYYSEEEIAKILKRSAKVLKLKLTDAQVADIAQRSRGVPRIANRLLKRLADYGKVTQKNIDSLWETFGVDAAGLDKMDRKVMDFLRDRERPVGVATMAKVIGLDADAIVKVIEPYLIRQGLMEIVPGGRQITAKGLK